MIHIEYEDEHLLVCRKPAGVHSQSSPDPNNMITLLRSEKRNEIYPVHRLDKETQGLMVYAKTQKAAAGLSRQFSENAVHKEYLALVHGTPTPNESVWEDLLYHDKQKNKSYTVKKERRGVKKAKLFYRVISTGQTDEKEMSLVRVTLFTGRTHQIRVQFASRGFPLSGDQKYGARDGIKTLCLCCVYLSFVHPITGKAMEFEQKDINLRSLFPNIYSSADPF